MNERVKVIAQYLQQEEPLSVLCERFEISRKTGDTWVARYDTGGVAALVDRSRARADPPASSSAVHRALCRAACDCAAPNAIWGADFKGHFPVADERGHPLTIMDGFSRTSDGARPCAARSRRRCRRSSSRVPRTWIAADHPYRQRRAMALVPGGFSR
jgi:hypothetical protein